MPNGTANPDSKHSSGAVVDLTATAATAAISDTAATATTTTAAINLTAVTDSKQDTIAELQTLESGIVVVH